MSSSMVIYLPVTEEAKIHENAMLINRVLAVCHACNYFPDTKKMVIGFVSGSVKIYGMENEQRILTDVALCHYGIPWFLRRRAKRMVVLWHSSIEMLRMCRAIAKTDKAVYFDVVDCDSDEEYKVVRETFSENIVEENADGIR